MDYLQYSKRFRDFNRWILYAVLNLIINGLPSILKLSFIISTAIFIVLNLIINGLPSILLGSKGCTWDYKVLNLIINGLPSIHLDLVMSME